MVFICGFWVIRIHCSVYFQIKNQLGIFGFLFYFFYDLLHVHVFYIWSAFIGPKICMSIKFIWKNGISLKSYFNVNVNFLNIRTPLGQLNSIDWKKLHQIYQKKKNQTGSGGLWVGFWLENWIIILTFPCYIYICMHNNVWFMTTIFAQRISIIYRHLNQNKRRKISQEFQIVKTKVIRGF